MATFSDIFNQAGGKLETAFNNPWMTLGLQLMQAGGPQQTDMSTGQRLAQAGMGFMDQRMQMAQLAQQKQLRDLQMAQAQREEDKAKRDAQYAEELRRNPGLLSSNPMAAAVLQAGGSVQDAMAVLKATQPKQPTAPFQYEMRGPDGSQTQYTYDASRGGYTAGPSYIPTDVRNADTAATNAQIAQSRLEKEQAEADRKYKLEQDRLRREQEAAERQRAADSLKSSMSKAELDAGYKGANAQFDKVIELTKTLENHAGLAGNFGVRGAIPTIPGTDAANARALLDELKANIGLSELVRLEQSGVKLTPVSNTDIAQAQAAGGNIEKLQDVGQAKLQLQKIREALEKAKAESGNNYSKVSELYKLQAPAQSAGQSSGGAAAPKNQAEYDALPSGTIYIDPQTGRQARKR